MIHNGGTVGNVSPLAYNLKLSLQHNQIFVSWLYLLSQVVGLVDKNQGILSIDWQLAH